ncbi:MAG: hypothetical protein LAT65_11980, partial [Saccharospirillum sp.]|nr:hypothetical protein [Saccharospirillum sp.]
GRAASQRMRWQAFATGQGWPGWHNNRDVLPSDQLGHRHDRTRPRALAIAAGLPLERRYPHRRSRRKPTLEAKPAG